MLGEPAEQHDHGAKPAIEAAIDRYVGMHSNGVNSEQVQLMKVWTGSLPRVVCVTVCAQFTSPLRTHPQDHGTGPCGGDGVALSSIKSV